MKKKILAFTSIRSDYDLLSGLFRALHDDSEIELKLLVSGAHLSKRYGYSVKLIENDGFDILLKVESLIDSDSKQSRIKTASILLQNAIDAVVQWWPDMILYGGDREDTLVAATIGGYLAIPTVHFFGGDHARDGHIDNPVRHAVSKLSTVHIVSIEAHKKRLIRIGEEANRIYCVGNIALEKFISHTPLPKNELKKNFKLSDSFLNNFSLVIFHPITTELEKAHIFFENILKALLKKKINAFISYPNTDPGNHSIIKVIEKYENNEGFSFYKNLERDIFLSIYKYSKFIIGNSSSGIVEAASVPIPAINVGLRQIGRFAGENVIYCDSNLESIIESINKAVSPSFKKQIKNMKNIYGDGNSVAKVYEIIKNNDFKELILKKEDPLDLDC